MVIISLDDRRQADTALTFQEAELQRAREAVRRLGVPVISNQNPIAALRDLLEGMDTDRGLKLKISGVPVSLKTFRGEIADKLNGVMIVDYTVDTGVKGTEVVIPHGSQATILQMTIPVNGEGIIYQRPGIMSTPRGYVEAMIDRIKGPQITQVTVSTFSQVESASAPSGSAVSPRRGHLRLVQ